jgi:hypothetical protein
MAEGGMGKSSKDESESSGTSAAATSRAVFISYASADAAVAQNVCAALEAAGILCWIAPRDVKPGAQYAGEAGWLFNATQCRVEPAERRYREVPAGLRSHGWRDARRSGSSEAIDNADRIGGDTQKKWIFVES